MNGFVKNSDIRIIDLPEDGNIFRNELENEDYYSINELFKTQLKNANKYFEVILFSLEDAYFGYLTINLVSITKDARGRSKKETGNFIKYLRVNEDFVKNYNLMV